MSDIKFDKSRKYVNRSSGQEYGNGVWYRDTNGDGKYTQGESLITLGNRIKNSNGSYSQLNSNGTITTLFNNGQVSKGIKVTNLDKQAMSKGLIYGRQAVAQGDKYVRSNKGKSSWDIDTDRVSQNGGFVDKYGNYLVNDQGHKYIGNINNKDIIGVDDNSYSNNGGKTFNQFNTTATQSPLITRRYSTQALGQYINPDTNQKTNYVKVNFGDTNGQNQYLKGNYWVYDDGNGNIQTIGFRYKDGKDYAFVNPIEGGQSFLNDNVKGTIIGQTNISQSRLKSYGQGFTPGMEKWRGKGGWYNNAGTALPDVVYGAKDGYLYDKQGRQIGFNAGGNYYLKNGISNSHKNSEELTTKNWTLGKELSGRWNDASNNFTEGFSGMWNDLGNFAGRFYKYGPTLSQRITGMFGDAGRFVQHGVQGTLGSIMALQMPQLGKEYIGKAGQVFDLGKDARSITSAFGKGKWVTPWDEENHGLSDYGDNSVDKQAWQDVNDVLNGATIILGTKGAGSVKGSIGNIAKNALQDTKALRFTEAIGKGTKSAATDIGNIYSKGAYYAGKATRAGLRPSNIPAMVDAVKQGFKNGRAYYKEATPIVTKPAVKPLEIARTEYIKPTTGKLNPNKGAEVIYNMKVNPAEQAHNVMNQYQFKLPSNKKSYVKPQISERVNPNKAVQTELQFVDEIPSSKKLYVAPQVVEKSLPVETPVQTVNRAQYISPNTSKLSPENGARIVYNMKIDPNQAAHNIMNQPRIILPETPIASKFTPKLNYNAESTVGNAPSSKIINYKAVDYAPNNSNMINWSQAKKVKTVYKAKPKSKTKKMSKKYLGGILTNNRFENFLNG